MCIRDRIIGDAKVILRKLNARLDPINHDEWIAHIERMKDMYPLRYDKSVLTGPFIIPCSYTHLTRNRKKASSGEQLAELFLCGNAIKRNDRQMEL